MESKLEVCGVKILNHFAKLPERHSDGAAGYDLYSSREYTIEPRGKELIDLGISICIPAGYYGRIAPRSSLAWKNHVDVGAGVIDSDYRGRVCVVLFNHGDEPFKVEIGDRVAQLIITKIITPVMVEVGRVDDTQRGEGGFGSTGK